MINKETQPQNPLANFEFQDFLAEQGLMKRDNQNPKNWALIPGRQSRHNSLRLWSILMARPGYIVHGTETARRLYGLESVSGMDNASQVGKYLRGLINEPTSLFASRIGQGIGVSDFAFTTGESLESLFALWEHSNKFVSSRFIALNLFSEISETTLDNTFSRFDHLKKLSFNYAEIQQARFEGERFYRLKTRNDKDENADRQLNPEEGRIFEADFQDWLGKAGVIEYSRQIGSPELKEGRAISEGQAKIWRFLSNHYGHLVPDESVGGALYGKRKPANWRNGLHSTLYVLRNKLIKGEDIFSYKDGLLAIGIKGLSLSRAQLNLLYPLWANQDEFVSAQEIYDDPSRDRIRVTQLTKGIRSGPYEIGSRVVEGGTQYILTHEENLVRAEAA